jgi:ribulose-phosphate 3-epimerase
VGKRALFEQLRATAPQLSVGVLTADWMSLGAELRMLEEAGVRLLHFDVMDGHFCPTLTFGAPVVAGLRTSLLKDVHLMVEEPLSMLESVVAAGADVVTIQVESTRHPHRTLQVLGTVPNANDPSRGIVRGVALNPGTPLDAIDPLVDEFEMVLLLAVNPGWGGQKMNPAVAGRVQRLREKVGRSVLVAVDGGVTRANIAEVARIGADIIVTGSAVFDGHLPRQNLALMMNAVKEVPHVGVSS